MRTSCRRIAKAYTFEPVTVTGKLAVLPEDPTGVFYRIVDAEEAN